MSARMIAAYRRAAKAEHEEEGRIEVDDNAAVSCGDPAEGAYVQAWVWVPRDLAKRAYAAQRWM